MAIGWVRKSSYVVCYQQKHTHVQATGDAGTLEGLVGTVLLTDGHETGHLNLGELDLAATEGGQGLKRESDRSAIDPVEQEENRVSTGNTYDVSDLELRSGGSHCGWM